MSNTIKNNASSEAIEKLYLNDELADVHFVFNVDKVVPANKSVLAALSPVFHKMFFGDLKEGAEVKIVDARAVGFKEFLQFFYLSEVTVTMENIETIVRLADKYDVLEYIKACVLSTVDELTVENMCWFYQLALILENNALIEFCESKLIKSSEKILATEAFKRCEQDTLRRILALDLQCDEVDVFNRCLRWAKNACIANGLDDRNDGNVKCQLGDCFRLIRFGAMKIDEFYAISNAHSELFTKEEFQDIVFAITMEQHEPKIFSKQPRKAWDQEKILICQRSCKEERYVFRSLHIVKFSSNKILLLKEIRSAETFGSALHTLKGVDIHIVISEFDFWSKSSVNLHEGSITLSLWENSIAKMILPQTILIKPNIVYKIQLKFPENLRNIEGYFGGWEQKVEMENGINIDFIQDFDAIYAGSISTSGWISALIFNQI